MHEDSDSRLRFLLPVALASILIGGVIDLALDRPTDWLSFHVVFESLMIAGALLMATTLWIGWWRAQRAADELRDTLAVRSQERDSWRDSAQRALEGFGHAIDAQFGRWELTSAEREVALLLLKGHSTKRIARITARSDATVRQHAAAVYRKSGHAGRAELAAFFLEDLMLPPGGLEPQIQSGLNETRGS